MRHWLYEGLQVVGADDLIYRVGLDVKYDPAARPAELSNGLLRVRQQLRERLPEAGLDGLIEHFDPERFNRGLSVAQNLGFGFPCPPVATAAAMAAHPLMNDLLQQFELEEASRRCGQRLARRLRGLLIEAGPLAPLPDDFSEFDNREFRRKLSDLLRQDLSRSEEGLLLLRELFLRIVPLRHGGDLLDDDVVERLMAARAVVLTRTDCPLCSSFEHFDEQRISSGLSVRENVVFGKIVGTDHQALERLQNLIDDVMQQEDADSMVMVLACFTQVGIRGAGLPLIAKQRIQLLRAIVKHPRILIMHEALTAMSLDERTRVVQRIRNHLPDLLLLYLDKDLPSGETFDDHYEIHHEQLHPLDSSNGLHQSLASSNL
ncbi:hypothetical protein [Marinobacterium aestuariivivens]|uniref:Uncharacterized protein n=1 Tax=Marinobacterium aestuariivivens TaxID=1698799 RepID=A0ABW2A8F4_9GAMM